MRFIALFLALHVCQSLARQVDFCYADDDDPYLNFATKTSYHFVHGGRTRFQTVPDCQPVQIWMASRHGARYPKIETITKLLTLPKLREQIVYNHEHRHNGHLCNQDLDNLKLWNPNPNLSSTMALRLTTEGAEDAVLLARRLQSNFPELLQPNSANITSQNYMFRSTSSDRTRASMESFMEGLFGSKRAVTPIEVPREHDSLLKPWKNCTSWEKGMADDPPSVEEYNNFLAGPEVAEVVQNISRRLGFQYTLSVASVQTMYDMCRFEKAWMVSKVSAWCAPFTKDELRVLEYAEDINYNYLGGNGRKINTRLGCPLLQDMFNNFKQLERGDLNGKPKGIFYFTHTITMLSLLTSIGIGTDSTPLLATNYKQMAKREFRTSLLSPFNGNLLAVFYRCKSSDGANKVMFYLQEKPLLLEGCQVGLCDWEYLKNKLGSVASECNLDFCWSENGTGTHRSWNILSVLIPTIIFIATGHLSRLSIFDESG